MGTGDERRDAGVLRALASDCRWRILQALRERALTQHKLERGLNFAPGTIYEHLQHLVHDGLVLQIDLPGRARDCIYSITDEGRSVRPIGSVASYWQSISGLPAPSADGCGSAAVRLVERPWVLPIMRQVAIGHHHRAEIADRLGIPGQRLTDQLKSLRDAGALLVERHHAFPPRVEAHLIYVGRRMPMIPLVSSTWEWRHRQPVRPEVASDLAGLLHIASALVRTPQEVNGTCQMSIAFPAAVEPQAFIYVHDGHIEVLKRTEEHADAYAEADPLSWGTSFITGTLTDIHITGPKLLPVVIVRGVRDALLRRA